MLLSASTPGRTLPEDTQRDTSSSWSFSVCHDLRFVHHVCFSHSPSSSSRLAPPPVLTWLTLSSVFHLAQQVAVSPPPGHKQELKPSYLPAVRVSASVLKTHDTGLIPTMHRFTLSTLWKKSGQISCCLYIALTSGIKSRSSLDHECGSRSVSNMNVTPKLLTKFGEICLWGKVLTQRLRELMWGRIQIWSECWFWIQII